MRCDICGRFTGISAGAVILTVPTRSVPNDGPEYRAICARCFDMNGGDRG